MNRYKKYRELGDEAITKRTAYRYRHLTSPSVHFVQEDHHLVIGGDQNISHEIERNNQYTEVNFVEQVSSVEFCNDLDDYLHEILLKDNFGNYSQSCKHPKTLEEMMESQDFFEPASMTIKKSNGELLFLVLKYSIVNSLSVTAMTNLFKLINVILEYPVLPDSRYLIDNCFNFTNEAEFHAVCPHCSAYIGKFGEIESVKNCRICNLQLDLSNPSNNSFFVLLDPSSQIRDLVSMYASHYDYVVKERHCATNVIEDVYDGKEYRKFVHSLSEEDKQRYISAVFNTDGAPKFKCSQYAIWPLYLMLNELPKQERMTKLVTCGLWFNKHKPDMNTFLGTFVDLINRLTKKGIPCHIRGQERVLKLSILSCCVDSVARAPIQGIKQFNGNYGCSWCLHPGKWTEDAIKYPLLESVVEHRDHESTIQSMMTATPNNPINGIKYASALINLPTFNIISGFVPDYLHLCLEGVAKQITEYHIKSMSSDDIAEIDFKINQITAPHQVSRLSRPLICRKDWKAREWENYTLYYSAAILSDYLSRDLFYHWLLFVQSLYILLKDGIHEIELNEANEMLHKFVADTEKYYGAKAMTYNIHQLLHIAESVNNWGPLWCQSTFSFESANHNLLKAIKCAKGVTCQIIRHININHSSLVLKERLYPHVHELIKMYCDDILTSNAQNYCKIFNITYFGRADEIDNELLINLNLSANAKLYFKIIKDGCLYESSVKSKRRSNNSFVLLNDDRFAQIDKFIIDEENMQEITIVHLIKTRNFSNNRYKALKIIDKIEEEDTIINTNEIKSICIFMKILYENMYILPLPNLLHY